VRVDIDAPFSVAQSCVLLRFSIFSGWLTVASDYIAHVAGSCRLFWIHKGHI
jgi:hypothetical protein